MIQANVSSTATMVNQKANEIRFKELTLFTANMGVVASLSAFFAETSIDSLYIEPETVGKDATTSESFFAMMCWSLSALTISLNLLTLLVSMYTMLYGPALAIRGPAGSMSIAVSRIFVQRRIALRLFWSSLLCKVVQTTCLAAWRYPPLVSTACAMVFGCFMVVTYRCIRRVTTKFSFSQFGLRRDDFIEIGVPAWHPSMTTSSSQRHNNTGHHAATGAVPRQTHFATTTTTTTTASRSTGVTQPLLEPEPDVCAGWLMKQSAYLKRWNSRYFFIADGKLMWTSSPDAPPKHFLNLATSELVVYPISVNKPGVFPYGLSISCRDYETVTELVVAAESPEARARWWDNSFLRTGEGSDIR